MSGEGRYWWDRQGPTHPGPIGKGGRLKRFTFVRTETDGRKRRILHSEAFAMLRQSEAKALAGEP